MSVVAFPRSSTYRAKHQILLGISTRALSPRADYRYPTKQSCLINQSGQSGPKTKQMRRFANPLLASRTSTGKLLGKPWGDKLAAVFARNGVDGFLWHGDTPPHDTRNACYHYHYLLSCRAPFGQLDEVPTLNIEKNANQYKLP